MKKDFDKWNERKKRIHAIPHMPFFHEREVWWCAVGVNVGFEQDGGGADFLRPVIVFRKFNKEIFWAIPLTHSEKKSKYYFSFILDDEGLSVAVLSQVRLVDAKRLSHKLGEISKDDFLALTKRFKALLP